MNTEKAVIVGAGPAGLAAANQLELYGVSPLVFESGEIGGLILNASSVVNYPGIQPGTPGRVLASLFPEPERIVKERITKIERSNNAGFEIGWETGKIHSQCVIVASGTLPVDIDLPGIEQNRIFHEVKNITPGKWKSAAVIGGGDAALDYALTLGEFMRVTVYTRSTLKGAVPHLHEKVKLADSISITKGIPDSFGEDIVVIACGRKANVGFIHRDLLCSPPEHGSFHLCGDCKNGIYRQISIAVGDGVKAAMRVAEYLRNGEKCE